MNRIFQDKGKILNHRGRRHSTEEHREFRFGPSKIQNLKPKIALFRSILFFILFLLSLSPCFAQGAFAPHIPPQAIDYQRARRTLGLFGMGWNVAGLWLFLRAGLAARLRDLFEKNKIVERDSAAIPVPPFRLLAGLLRGVYRNFAAVESADWPDRAANRAAVRIFHAGGWRISARFVAWFFVRTADGFVVLGRVSALREVPAQLVENSVGGHDSGHRVSVHFGTGRIVSPAFNKYTPLPDTPLRAKILALADRAGITGANVFVEDTSRRTRHVNAYVTGIGPTTRIVINDTALQTLPEDQMLAMIGHEMGHYVEGHLWAGMFGADCRVWARFCGFCPALLPILIRRERQTSGGLNGPTDLAAIPLLSLLIALFLIIQAPIASGISRYLEHRADAFGLRLTHLNGAMIRLFIGFAERDYSDPDPPAVLQFWFGTHPTLKERIEFART